MARQDEEATALAPEEPPVSGSDGPGDAEDEFLESLMDTNLYSMGAFFSDQHPDLVDEVIERAEAIERTGLRGYAEEQDLSLEECFQTLLTGLAVRYYKAVAA